VINPEVMANMPNVAAWLRHSQAARQVVDGYPGLEPHERHRAAALENVVIQLTHLRTHPSVAAGIARGALTLHGWYFDIHAGEVLALDGATGHFRAIEHDQPVPVALAAAPRRAAEPLAEAAE
jgi:carbonic anhydrase